MTEDEIRLVKKQYNDFILRHAGKTLNEEQARELSWLQSRLQTLEIQRMRQQSRLLPLTREVMKMH